MMNFSLNNRTFDQRILNSDLISKIVDQYSSIQPAYFIFLFLINLPVITLYFILLFLILNTHM